MRRAIITLLVLLSFGLKAQVYQAMPQAGYGPVKRMLFDSVLTIPLNINQLRNITGGRDAGQIRYNVTDSGLYVFSGYQWIKANLDSTNISNRINGKLNISDTAQMLSVYMKYLDTLSLSNRINLRVKYSDTAQMLLPYLRKLDTASLSRRIDKKQDSIILTTNFKSGAATLNGANLNIPKYSDTLSDAYVPYVGANKDVDLGVYDLTGTFLTANAGVEIQDNGAGIGDKVGYTSLYTSNEAFNFRTSRLLPNNLTKSRQATFLYPVEGDGYLTTFNYNLPVRTGTLALVEDTVNLSNRINLKADKATTLTINGVTYNLSANRSWTIPVFDSTSISNRIDLKLNISDTASMLSPYLRKADTSSLSNRIDLKLNATDTASLSNRINLKADKSTTLTINGTSYDLSANRSWTIPTVDTTSLSNRINLKVNISDTAAMLNPYLRKVDTTNAFLTSVSQPNDSTLSFVKGSTLSSYIIRASTQGSATKLITNVYNNSGATILKGSVVYINGAHSSNLPTIALAIASNEATSAFTYGVVENDIPNNTAGVVVQNGVVTGLNLPTATYSDGQTLYLSPTVAGGYTLTKVIAPNHYVAVGTVTRAHPTFGTIQVAIRNGFQLDELSDVLIAAIPLDSTVLQFSRVDSLWHDVSITSAIGSKYIKPTDTTSLSNRINAKADALSGTTNTVPKFTSSTTIGNSNIKDNGSAVTINATAGSFGALQVGSYNGNILMNTTNSNGGLIFQNTSSSNKLWDFSSDNNDLVFNESNIAPVMKLKAGGNVVISNLSGTGTRMVVADANGVLSSQAISSDTTSLSNRINLKLNISDTASMLSPYLRKADTSSLSNRINTKQNIITLTTTGTSGAATFSSNTLNIPQYQAAGTYVTSVTGTSPIISSGGTTPAISIPAATSLVNGYLSSTDWTTFNNKGSGTVTSVAALTLGTSGTDLSSTVANGTTTPVITLNVPTASATNRGALSSSDWTTFNNKQSALTNPVTGTGTNGYHAKFTSTGSTIGNSVLYDNGTNVGLGVIPSAWSAFSALQLANGVHLASYTSGVNILDFGINYYFNGSAYILNTTDAASSYQMRNGEHRFNVAPSGTAGTSANFTEVMRLFNSGNVLIQSGGTFTDAGYKLDVNGTVRTLDFSIKNSANAETIDLFLSPSTSNGFIDYPSSRSFTIRNKGSLGGLTLASTGAASFTNNVEVQKFLTVSSASSFTAPASGKSIEMLYRTDGANDYAFIQTYDRTNSIFKPLRISGSTLILNSDGGNVGIGTTSPGSLLTVSSNSTDISAISTGSNVASRLILKTNASEFRVGSSTDNNWWVYDATANAYRMTITSGGNVGIGTTSPSVAFHVANATATTVGMFEYTGGANTYVGIKSTAGTVYLGNVNNNMYFEVNNAQRMAIASNGNVTINSLGTGTVYSNGGILTNTNPSDSSLKNSISPLSYGLSEILKLEPKTFYYNSDSTKASLKYGFIAQDVQPIMPDLVRTIGNGSDKLGLESDGIYVTMVNAIKELSAQIKELQTKIQTLENK